MAAAALLLALAFVPCGNAGAAEATRRPEASTESPLELLRRQEERRKREDAERNAYVRETDELIRSIRTQIFDIELTITEVRYILDNFECAAAESFEVRLEEKLTDLRTWEGEIAARCDGISPSNEAGQAICKERRGGVMDQIQYYESIKGRSLRACDAQASGGGATTGPKEKTK